MKIAYIAVLALLLFCIPVFAEVTDSIVAVINDEVITQGEVEAIAGPLKEQIIISAKKQDAAKMLDELRQEIINKLIEDRLILQEAERRKVIVREEEIDDMVSQMEGRFKTEDELEDALVEQNMSLDKLKSKFKDQIMMRKLISREVRSKTIVTPTEITDYYEAHKDEFIQPETLKVRHILIRAQDDKAKDTSRKKAEDIVTLLKNGGDFAELAKRYSEGPNAEAGGDMGYIKRGRLIQKMDDAIFSVNVGEASGLVETELGYHIFKVEEKKQEKAKALEEARVDIEELLYKKKAEARYGAWVEKLKKNAYILIK